ncbi:MAG TPA: hypothetical protein V6C58_01070 [Allocoleopsis sp.]
MQNIAYTIYDVVTKEEINIAENSILLTSKKLGICYTALSKLGKKNLHINNRYISKHDKNKIFTLVELDSGNEYDCITYKTFFIHLNIPYSNNEAKYIYCLKSNKQKYASINGKVYYLKNSTVEKRSRNMKAHSEVINQRISELGIKRNAKYRYQHRLKRALKLYGGNGSKSAIQTLGIDNDSFIKYIQSKFTKGMSWENKNLWHIDHIKPCSKFDLTKEEDVKKCFHYTNLQPIWKTTKIAKQFNAPVHYKGNQNKSNTGLEYDYHLVEILDNKYPDDNNLQLCVELFKRGIKKVY